MEFEKAIWTTEGDNIVVTMPIAKINKEQRTVSGFATLDNVDTQNDIVTADASERAFSKWRGNVREQHLPIAVGKVLSFDTREFFDEKNNTNYKGMYVNAYISKGAQDTWEKVLDGTLTGFSIGGGINKSQNVFTKEAGQDKRIRKVTDYTITELSLVDNPANQLANIFSIQKSADGAVEVTGLATNTQVDNIFYCKDDGIATTSDTEAEKCVKCQGPMEIIGFIEEADKENEEKLVKSAVNNFISSESFALEEKINDNVNSLTININGVKGKKIDKILKSLNIKGGVDVTEEAKTEVVEETTVEEVSEPVKVEKSAEVSEVEVPETAEVSEVQEPNLQKMFSDLTETLTGAINSAKEETSGAIEGFEKSVTGIQSQVSELTEKVTSLEEKVNSSTSQIGEVEKRIDGVVSETAMQKSGDLGGDSAKIEKSIWNGAFLPAAELVNN